MKVTIKGHSCYVEREPDDPKFYNGGHAGGNGGESRLLYHVKNILNEQGHDLIKIQMTKDKMFFHMVSDGQQYLRTRSPKSPEPHVWIYNPNWVIKGAEADYNEIGLVVLQVEYDIFD